ncbi:MAG: KEOPS complex subunit Cgi121 [Candidatus Thermoplasmatota archaeon]
MTLALPELRAYHADISDVPALVKRIPPRVQLLRADRVYGPDHLTLAAQLAARALAEGRARSADIATETLVYAAGERQIGKALVFLGLHEGAQTVAAVAWDPAALDAFAARERWRREDALLEGDESVLDAFHVSAAERALFPRERWGDIILERVALTDVLKA